MMYLVKFGGRQIIWLQTTSMNDTKEFQDFAKVLESELITKKKFDEWKEHFKILNLIHGLKI